MQGPQRVVPTRWQFLTSSLIITFLLLLAAGSVPAADITGTPGSPGASATIDGRYIPSPPPPFRGQISPNAVDLKPYWESIVVPPKGAPNVLLIMIDNEGFSAPSTFNGVIPTPAMDRIANAGLRYTAFHTTALRSPTWAALLTGRNHHLVATCVVVGQATGYPGYNSVIPRNTVASSANIVPRLVVEIYDKFMAGDLTGALESQYRLAPMRMAYNIGSFPVVTKDYMRLLGFDVGEPIRPNTRSAPDSMEKLKKLLEDLGAERFA